MNTKAAALPLAAFIAPLVSVSLEETVTAVLSDLALVWIAESGCENNESCANIDAVKRTSTR